MRLNWTRRTVLAVLMAGGAGFLMPANAENWPCWRGPRQDGTSLETRVPADWSPAAAEWNIEVPGKGHASAVVWEDRVLTVTAFPETRERVLLCFNRADGKILWQKTVVTGPLEKLHVENSYASGTPATDGKRVYVTFRVGDEVVVAAHDLADGRQLWLVRPGTHAGEWGFSNEPVLFEDKVILDGDGKEDSFLVALNRETGKTLWRVSRPNKGISYSAPFIREMAGRLQMVQCGDRRVTSFDPRDGRELWTVDGPSQEFVATPTYSEKTRLVYVSSSWPERHLLAIKPDGEGNVTKTHIVWRDTRGAPYIPSLMTVGDYVFSVGVTGTAFCYDAATGKVHWQEVFGRHHASPVLAGGRLYFINDKGEVIVIKPGAVLDRSSGGNLGESCYASPALSDGQVFLRGFKHLMCIGKRTPVAPAAAAGSNPPKG